MAIDWIRTTIGSQVTLQRGIDITRVAQRPGAIPVISSGGTNSFHNAAAAKGPGVVLGRKGVVGSVFYVDTDYWPHDTTLWVKEFQGNIPRFVYYFFRWFAPELARMDVGSANPTLNRNHVHPIQIWWPTDREEQRKISNVLGALDDKIELNRKMNQTLEAMARALFKSWFVDFDPVRAKAEGRDPGLPSHIAALFPDSFVDSVVGEIPEGWKSGSLADYALLNPESWSKETRPDAIRYADLANTKWGKIETLALYSRDDAPSRAQRVLRPGDTIVGTVRPGNGSYAMVDEDGITGSTGFAVLRPQAFDSREFVYLAATAAANIEALAHVADGGAYPAIRPEIVLSTPTVCPPAGIVTAFAGVARPLLGRIAHNGKESRSLAAIRDLLLPKLISGDLRVAS